jgi:hypothetical protein
VNAIADMVTRLIAAGTPPEVAAVVVAEAFAAGVSVCGHSADKVDESAERRRAKDRERKRDVRRHSAESADIPQNSKPALTLTSSQQEVSVEKEGKKVSARKIPLPQTWQPSEVHFEAAAKLNVSREAVLNKAEDMRIWAGSNGALKKDWHLTFHGFLRRDAPKLAAQNGKQNGPTAPNGLATALGKLRENIGQPGGSEAGRGPPPRLLSHG